MPVWIMRQAGRYLPSYRALRSRAGSFLALMKTPEYSAEATLQPIELYDLDAAIIFSDILTVPDAMGLGLQFTEGVGPSFKRPITSSEAIDRLALPDTEKDYLYLQQAISLTLDRLNGRVPLIGFAGSPVTLAKYMLEQPVASWVLHHPDALRKLLAILATAIKQYLSMQIEAGVHAVQVFDSWGHHLETEENYQKFSIPFFAEIFSFLHNNHPNTPIILYTRQEQPAILNNLASIPHLTALSINYTADIPLLRAANPDLIIQGNLDPATLTTDAATVRDRVKAVLSKIYATRTSIFLTWDRGLPLTPSQS